MANTTKELKLKKTYYCDRMPINLQQGFLIDYNGPDIIIVGAYNSDKEIYTLKEGTHPTEVSLPKEVKGYNFIGVAGHFEIQYWSFKEGMTVTL